MDRIETRLLPTPEGFATVQLVNIFPVTRKLVARGVKADGAQLLVYDLVTGDLQIVANPPGVAWIGPPVVAAAAPGAGGLPGVPGGPGQAGGGGAQAMNAVQGLQGNTKANTVEAIAYNAARQQTGIAVLRVP